MNLFKFQQQAAALAMYPKDDGIPLVYLSLGIIGECGEVAEKIKKLIRDDNWNMTKNREEDIAKELGDCIWYVANICSETNHELSMIYSMRGSAIQQLIRNFEFPELILHMNIHAVKVATSLQNWYYRNNGRISERNTYIEIPNHLSNVIACIEEIAHRCGFALEDICDKNIDKLLSRKKRGKLSGSGDNR